MTMTEQEHPMTTSLAAGRQQPMRPASCLCCLQAFTSLSCLLRCVASQICNCTVEASSSSIRSTTQQWRNLAMLMTGAIGN